MTKTPSGQSCNAFERDGRMHNTLKKAARGAWQHEVLRNLMDEGYVIGYRATGPLRGRAKSYQSHYAKSLTNMMDRIEEILETETEYRLERGSVGPKGGWGYYITT